ncbi:hypothetical protein EII18_05370 [Comamonadaceae bacterium OH3737_COT-264]|uniref:hypothetical protein n=1 Tax=Allofranklinella schreckenbergeri TaxID=1076744 RepID=UPI000F5E2F5A|nr:hypothetical protein [Allofranklinella schreckenbergeri]RRD42524.1 hypothetical protein EII18_05370 [Comamonadaceae bacterium OH3737_COT-264]
MSETVAPLLQRITVRDLALSLGVSRQRANRLLLDGRVLHAQKHGRHWMVPFIGFTVVPGARGPRMKGRNRND